MELQKQNPPMPRRMSEPKVENTKPSNVIAVFWWVVFIIPVAFTYLATQSLLLIGVLVGLRIAIMFLPAGWIPGSKKKVIEPKKPEIIKKEIILIAETVNTKQSILTPYKDELISEWKGLLKMLRIYDHDTEDKYLNDYRQLRGWNK
jgi:hypothetical protein